MAIINKSVSVSPKVIPLDGKAEVTLDIMAQPHLFDVPTDIVMVLDKTEAVQTEMLEEIKKGARDFVERVAIATGSSYFKPLLKGVKIGTVVCTDDRAVTDARLTDSTGIIDGTILNLTLGSGLANHAEAFQVATSMLDAGTGTNKIIIFFSYSETQIGGDAAVEAQKAKDKGYKVYALGPELRRPQLTEWASTPKENYVCINVGGERMNIPFDMIAEKITAIQTTDALLISSLSPDFEVSKVISISHGTAEITTPQMVTWKIGTLGATAVESAKLVYEVCHIGKTSGEKPVTESNELSTAGIQPMLIGNPDITVTDCSGGGTIIVPTEGCSAPVDINVPSCDDTGKAVFNNLGMASLGRMISVDLTIMSVCPGKRVAASVILSEVNTDGTESPRGIKHILVPAHTGTECQDIRIECVQFSVPEELDEQGGGAICKERNFRARVVTNYVDTDFVCCNLI